MDTEGWIRLCIRVGQVPDEECRHDEEAHKHNEWTKGRGKGMERWVTRCHLLSFQNRQVDRHMAYCMLHVALYPVGYTYSREYKYTNCFIRRGQEEEESVAEYLRYAVSRLIDLVSSTTVSQITSRRQARIR